MSPKKKVAGNRGGGRRSLGSAEQRGATIQRSIRIHEELWSTVVFAARASGITTSEYIREAILAKLKADRKTR